MAMIKIKLCKLKFNKLYFKAKVWRVLVEWVQSFCFSLIKILEINSGYVYTAA